jgi:uncharacterized protein YeeX (DUF496 family)
MFPRNEKAFVSFKFNETQFIKCIDRKNVSNRLLGAVNSICKNNKMRVKLKSKLSEYKRMDQAVRQCCRLSANYDINGKIRNCKQYISKETGV